LETSLSWCTKKQLMKNLYLPILACTLATSVWAQSPLLVEHFDYPANAQLRDHGWTPHSAGGTNPLAVHTTGLAWTITPYAGSNLGLAAAVTNTGSDENKPFSSAVDSNSVYAAMLVKPGGEVTTAGAGYFFHLAQYADPVNPDPTSISTAFRARTFIATGSTPATFRLGLSFNSATVPSNVGVDVTNDLDTAKTYLVVVKYTFVSGPDNDQVSLFVFEDGDSITTEPAPTLGPLTGTAPDVTSLQAVALRQYNAAQNIIVDGIIVHTVWDFLKVSGLSATDGPQPLSLSVYPNPSTNGRVYLQTPMNQPMDVTLSDLSGKVMQSTRVFDGTLDVAAIAPGVYILTVQQAGKVTTQKFVVQ
jgi:hypothetical protein